MTHDGRHPDQMREGEAAKRHQARTRQSRHQPPRQRGRDKRLPPPSRPIGSNAQPSRTVADVNRKPTGGAGIIPLPPGVCLPDSPSPGSACGVASSLRTSPVGIWTYTGTAVGWLIPKSMSVQYGDWPANTDRQSTGKQVRAVREAISTRACHPYGTCSRAQLVPHRAECQSFTEGPVMGHPFDLISGRAASAFEGQQDAFHTAPVSPFSTPDTSGTTQRSRDRPAQRRAYPDRPTPTSRPHRCRSVSPRV